MRSFRRVAAYLLAFGACVLGPNLGWAETSPASGFSGDSVRIGVLTDTTGPFTENTGEGSITAARMAIEDFGGSVLGRKIELLTADHQNKTDIASGIAREWFDRQNVRVVVDLINSSVALAVMNIARDKNRIAIVAGSGSTRISNENCNPVTFQWAYDSYASANTTARALVASGARKWFFITADYAFGHSMEKDTTEIVRAAGGEVVGSVRHPLNTSDFGSYILAAQQSGADVVALANAAADTVNSVKQAAEFGLPAKQKLIGLIMAINDVNAIGLETTQGMYLTESFYWDRDEATRAFSRRYFAKRNRMPNMVQAAIYSAVTHYLNAVQTSGTDETGTVIAKMRATHINDMFVANGRIREDGIVLHNMYLMRVKAPADVKYPWDYMRVEGVVPGEDAFAPLSASRCPLAHP